MFQKRNQGCRNTGNLIWSNIDKVYLLRFNYRIITIQTGKNSVCYEHSVFVQVNVSLCDKFILFIFCIQIYRFRLQIYFRSEEHTSELQSRENLVCRLLLET